MNLPMHYRTGNRKLDEKIARQLAKQSSKPTVLQILTGETMVLDPENKYHVADKEERTYKDGTLFASKGEMERYEYLVNLERAGEITNLRTQVPFTIYDSYYHHQYGKIQEIVYVCDFLYMNVSYRKGYEGREIVEDHKSGPTRTSEYKLKRKLFLYRYPNYVFFEVT